MCGKQYSLQILWVLKKILDKFILATSLIARSSFRAVKKVHAVLQTGNGMEAVVAEDVIPGLYLQPSLCCIYLELVLSILHTREPRAVIPHLIQLRI